MSAAEFYNHTTFPSTGAQGSSSAMRAELELIEQGFGKLPDLSGNGGKIVAINSGASALEAITTTGTGNGVRATSPTLVTPILGTPTSGTLTNCTGLPISSGLSGAGTGVLTALAIAIGSAGAFVVNGGVLGTPSSGALTNCTGLPISTGVSGLGSGVATFLGTPSSANLASAVTDETGSGALVFANSPTLVTPALGTPSSGTLTNCTGLPIASGISGLGSGIATFLATPSSANLAAAITDETGTGSLVFSASPTFTGTVAAAAITASGAVTLNGNLLNFGSGSTLAPYIQHTGATLDVKGGSTGGLRVLNNAGSESNFNVHDWGGIAARTSITAGTDLIAQSGALYVGSSSKQLLLRTLSGVNRIDSYDNPITATVPLQLNASTYAFQVADSTKMTLDSSGNLGLGVTPSASVLPTIQSQYGLLVGNDSANITGNAYYGSGAWTKFKTGASSLYEQRDGVHYWHTSPSGAAGAAISFTQAMTLDASGNLGLGVTPSAWGVKAIELPAGSFLGSAGGALGVIANGYWDGASYIYKTNGFATNYIANSSGQHLWYTAPSGTAGNAISFTQAMTLDANGDLVLGSTTTNAIRITVQKTNPANGILAHIYNDASSSHTGAQVMFTQDAVANWVIGQPAGTNAFSIWRDRNTGAGGTLVAQFDSSGNLTNYGTVAASGSANVITAAGSSTTNPVTITATGSDTNIDVNVVPKGSGQLKVNGTAIVPAGLVLLDTKTASSSSSLDFTSSINSTYDEYVFEFVNLVPSAASIPWVRTSTDGGSTFAASASDYAYTGVIGAPSPSVAAFGSTGAAQIALSDSNTSNTASHGGLNGRLVLFAPSGSTQQKVMTFDGSQANTGTTYYRLSTTGVRLATADVDAISILPSTGNWTSGTVRMYGVRKS